MTLKPDFLYPLYDHVGQRRAFERGEATHKLPKDMNRYERRRVEARKRKRTPQTPTMHSENKRRFTF